MRIIGITGGIGCGKSTVSKILFENNIRVIDADNISRKIVKNGSPALIEIESHFGKGILLASGELNRSKLRKIVYDDYSKLNLLNSITHKYISQQIKNEIDSNINCHTIAIDAAIPLKLGFLDVATEVWVVFCKLAIRIERIKKRDKLALDDDVLKIINSQLKDEDYFKIAKHIIYNNGSYDDLRNNTLKLLYLNKYIKPWGLR